MESIILKATQDTPKVSFDAEKSIFEISGKSLPEDALSFYKPVFKWLDEYLNTPNKSTVFNFRFDYFNSASSKIIVELLKKISILQHNNDELTINWYFRDIDEDMQQVAEEFAYITNVKMNYIPVETKQTQQDEPFIFAGHEASQPPNNGSRKEEKEVPGYKKLLRRVFGN